LTPYAFSSYLSYSSTW